MKRQVRAGFHDPSPVTRTVVLSLFFSCSLLVSAEGPDYGSVLKEELIQRESKVDSVEPLMADAISLRDAGKFKEAVAKCDAALSKLAQMNLGDGPSVVARKSMILQLKMEIRSQWGKSLILQAKQLMQKGYSQAKTDQASSTANIQKAIELAREAKREAPETLDAADEIIQLGDKVIKSNKFIQETNLSVIDPDNTSRKEQIAIHLREAQIFYKSRQYSRARDVLEQVLVLDPYNDKAVFELKKIYKKLYSFAELRRENEMLERLNELEWKWNNSILPRGDQIVEDRGPQEAANEGKAQMYEKLQSIIIPEVDFGGVNISSIVRQLNKRSRECDPEGKGINLIYSPSDDDMQEVTLQFTNLPIGEIIRYLCQYAKLKYKVEDKAVTIGSKGIDDMDTRYFKMRSALYNRLSRQSATKKKKESSSSSSEHLDIFGGKKVEDVFKDESKDEENAPIGGADFETLKKYFEVRGITFDPGSSIAYDERSSKLIVKNTPENLRKLDALLREIDIVTPLVLIEAKFLEITVSDLEELGFDWTMTKNNSNPAWMAGVIDTNTAKPEFMNSKLMQTLVRHYGSSESPATTDDTLNPGALINNLNIMPNFGPDGAYNIFLTVNAIDQSERGEILSAPKVIATSGLEATIQFAKDMYFPESWNDPEVTSTNNTYEYTPPYPDFSDATPIGITFTVLPTVSPNNHTISLDLKPQVLDLVGWTVYAYDIVIGNITAKSDDTNTETRTPVIKMPEISVREIDTKVKVYDGETVVLGGILDDKSSRLDDKYPFFGDVPLLGRLFSSQSYVASKTNLMIFVTTRIMNLDGVPVKSKNDNGLFDFNR